MKHQTISGRIEYRIEEAGIVRSWGEENFRMTKHGDGSRVVRATCEMGYTDLDILRDVVQSVDAGFHPQDVFVRLTVDDVFLGSTWYWFTDEQAEYQGYTVADGRIQERVPISRNIRGFGTHSLIADGWLSARFDRTQGPRVHTFTDNLLTSIHHLGATGPAFERTTSSSMEYFGEEVVSVQAGEFACHHFAFVATSNDHPRYHFWVTSDGDFLFVKGTVDAPYNWSFELVERNERR